MITRFAPSPTGYLHLGHAYSALTAWDRAVSAEGVFRLRIEDIDTPRCRAEFETAIFEDLHWLGIAWPDPVLRQSDRLSVYARAVADLTQRGLTYPCTCTRGDIRAALSAPQEGAGPQIGPDGPVYPGTCRGKPAGLVSGAAAIRLDMRKAIGALGEDRVASLCFHESGPMYPGTHALDPEDLLDRVGDIVLARRDIGTSYHIAVVVDDHEEAVTEVVRGVDLFSATRIHRLLQALLEMPAPAYFHHDLIRDDAGKRLAKRDDARSIRQYRARGLSAQDVRELVGL